MLREAARSAVRFHASNSQNADLYISVNVTLQQFQQLHFVTLVRDILLETGANPKWIRLELTESTAATNPSHAARTIRQLNAMGIKVSIDDFGTGFSTMEQLRRIPFNELKVDQSFVHGATHNHVSHAILESSLNLAKKLAIKTVAEGVENQTDFDLVKTLGYHIIQGYMFAKPMPMEDFCGWMTAYNQKG